MPPLLEQPQIFEKGDNVYLVGPVQSFAPSQEQMEEFAFATEVKKQAPNPNIIWYQGQYVEADQPNANGHMWRSGELAIASMTPMFMPVTVMHDPRTAVGLIADLSLKTPEKDAVPRSKIETALAVWKHRFPEVAEEAEFNAAQGTLMQSMECLAGHYSCGECGMTFHKMPRGAERSQWCAHLKGETGATPVRILGSVCFTGTGLIFGTRGARGADSQAYLASDFQEEVAEFHQNWHKATRNKNRTSPGRTTRMETVEISKAEYDRLQAFEEQAQTEKARADEAERKVEQVEAEKGRVEQERDTIKGEKESLEENARQGALRDERMNKLGQGFTAKLGETTKSRLHTQAAEMSDEDWTARLEELEEAYGVKADDAGDGSGNGGGGGEGGGNGNEDFTAADLGSLGGGGNGNGAPPSGQGPSDAQRRQTVGSLAKAFGGSKK